MMGIFRLCLNDSFFFLEPIVVSQKEKKGGRANVRSLRLKNSSSSVYYYI